MTAFSSFDERYFQEQEKEIFTEFKGLWESASTSDNERDYAGACFFYSKLEENLEKWKSVVDGEHGDQKKREIVSRKLQEISTRKTALEKYLEGCPSYSIERLAFRAEAEHRYIDAILLFSKAITIRKMHCADSSDQEKAIADFVEKICLCHEKLSRKNARTGAVKHTQKE